jgi:hypothetical protein
MINGSDRPYQLGDGDREIAAQAKAVLDHLRAARPAEITNAERDADKAEIAKLKADLDLTKRAVVNHGKEIRQLKADLAAVRNVVIELQQQRRPPARISALVRKRDGLDAAVERELYD